MKHDAPFIVKRFQPDRRYGPGSRQRVSAAFFAYTLDDALIVAAFRRIRNPWVLFWIEKRGEPATKHHA